MPQDPQVYVEEATATTADPEVGGALAGYAFLAITSLLLCLVAFQLLAWFR